MSAAAARRALVVALSLALLVGCGPIHFGRALRPARRALAEAEAAGAADHAPYELALARARLAEARDDAGASRYQDAADHARAAERAARLAARRALERRP